MTFLEESLEILTVKDIKAREPEYREFLRKMIRAKTAQFVKSAKLGEVITPKWRGASKHDVTYFWRDELWCQDTTLLAWEEFAGGEVDFDNDETQDYLNAIFDEEFRGLAKELELDVSVLE